MGWWWRDERGTTSIEYALIATLIAVLIIGAIRIYGANVLAMYTQISDAVLAP